MREGCRPGSQRRSQVTPQPLIERRTRIDPRGGDYRHAGAERDIGRRIVHVDLDRYALDNLDEVAGSILGGQQRERGSGPGLDALDMTVDLALRIGGDPERPRIPLPHLVEFILLEVRRHPDLIRYK